MSFAPVESSDGGYPIENKEPLSLKDSMSLEERYGQESRETASRSDGTADEANQEKRSEKAHEGADATDDMDVEKQDSANEGGNGMEERPPRRHKPKQYELQYQPPQKSLFTINNDEAHESQVDEVAHLLAAVDDDSYRKSVSYDSEKLLQGIVLPMSFPWYHSAEAPLKNAPCDIDEMPDILRIDDVASDTLRNGLFGYGKFEVGKSRRGYLPEECDRRAASRRSTDVGTIELTTVPLDDREIQNSQVQHQEKKRKFDDISSDESKISRVVKDRADVTREYYNIIVDIDKKRKETITKNTSKKFITVRFGSTSSRRKLFTDSAPLDGKSGTHVGDEDEEKREQKVKECQLLLPALLPLEVQQGRCLVVTAAVKNTAMLGEYDMRYGAGANQQDSKAKRVHTGRVRRLWTKAHIGQDGGGAHRSRASYSSRLTTERIWEANDYKRPREVMVGIRINGSLLTFDNTKKGSQVPNYEGCFEKGDDQVSILIGLSDKAINDAIQRATCVSNASEGKPHRPQSRFQRGPPMCMFDSEEYVLNLVKAKGQEKCTVNEMEGNQGSEFKDPSYECLPVSDGPIRVICTQPGTLKPHWIPSIPNEGENVCSVCWSKTSEEKVEKCASCSVEVHLRCCLSKGEKSSIDGIDTWKCAACCSSTKQRLSGVSKRRKSKTPLRFRTEEESKESKKKDEMPAEMTSFQCRLCPHYGGAMSPVDQIEGTPIANGGLVHEVCRIWTRAHVKRQAERAKKDREVDRIPLLGRMRSVCSICGKKVLDVNSNIGGVRELTKCGASGCNVYFHPMCALVCNKFSSYADKQNGGAHTDGTGDENPNEVADKLNKIRSKDESFCRQYTLAMMRCWAKSKSGCGIKEKILPVAFCKFHNPRREVTLFGAYPGASAKMSILANAMSVPPKKKEKKTKDEQKAN